MIRAEYTRFLQTLNVDDIGPDVRKIANIVLKDLDILIPLSTAKGQRIIKMVKLAQESWGSVSPEIRSPSEHVTEQTCPIKQLKRLSVGPFRGFAKQEDFDLASELVLIYGPNGTGKSSFCEALEYSLLGNVAEAESKRFRNQQDYLKNAHTKSFNPPILIGEDKHGKDIPVSANEALYRFSFVEKNRIDNFSRIAAQAPAKQSELISTLFGLDAFTEFVRNFTDTMDDRYIDLEGVKSLKLYEKRQTLAGYQLQLTTTVHEEFQSIENDEKTLANEYREGCGFTEMVTELNDHKVGLIKQFEYELQKPIVDKSNLKFMELHTLKQSIETNIEELSTKQTELSNASQQVSFKRLYETVIKLKEISQEQCPACLTPLSKLRVNPFDYAEAELVKLQNLNLLQDELKLLESDVGKSLDKLSDIINACCSRAPENNPLSVHRFADEHFAKIDWWLYLHKNSDDGLTPWHQVDTQVKNLEELDKVIDQTLRLNTEKENELRRLREFAEKIVKLQTRRETANNAQKKANEVIEKFNTENAQLISEVETEKLIVAQNRVIAFAYDTYVQKLNIFKDDLPSQLVANLGETTVQLYNAFNRNDEECEQFATVKLPLQQNQPLEIAFKNNPTCFFDALHILSEGHIRCVGLAILMAKNIKENCPLLIFDDPVNSIDDDHKESIRRTLFEDSFFNDKQIILACHGEEFLKDIQNLLSAEKAKQSKIVSFLPRIGDDHLRVDLNCSSRNYIITARAHFNRSEIRDALSKSRQALESLTKEKVWRYVNKHGDGNLSIKLNSATASIGLRNLTEQLKSKIVKADFLDRNKIAILTPIESLLGVNGESREWRYLNKGTHEETNRAEFDRNTVNEIVTALEQLDIALE